MQRNVAGITNISSSFLSCERDVEIIFKKLFVESRPYNEQLIRLLTIPNADCLDNNCIEYQQRVKKYSSIRQLKEDGYIRLEPKILLGEHEELKSYIVLSFDNFAPNGTNPEYRDHMVIFDIICPLKHWDVGNYRQRPLKIMGYIDGILQHSRLTGIGTFQFMGSKQYILDENFAGYSLSFFAINGGEDRNANIRQ